MNRFFVGQRVRVIRARHAPWLVGMETQIVAEYVMCGVDYWEIPGDWLFAKSVADEALVPISPEGHQASDQSFEQLMADLKKGVIHA